MNDGAMGFFGFVLGNIYAITWINNSKEYVRERLELEKDIGFSRSQFLKYENGQLLDEYMDLNRFAGKLLSDEFLKDERKINTTEIEKVKKLREIHEEFGRNRPPVDSLPFYVAEEEDENEKVNPYSQPPATFKAKSK